MISWDYPHDSSLSKRVSMSGIRPITSLSCLKKAEKQKLMAMGIVTCNVLLEHRNDLIDLGFSDKRVNNVFRQVEDLVNYVE